MDGKFAEPLERGAVWAPRAQVVWVPVLVVDTGVVMEWDGSVFVEYLGGGDVKAHESVYYCGLFGGGGFSGRGVELVVLEVEFSGTIWSVESGIFGLLGFCDKSGSCERFLNGDRSCGVGLGYRGVECGRILLELLECDVGGVKCL